MVSTSRPSSHNIAPNSAETPLAQGRAGTPVQITLNAVLAALKGDDPCVLSIKSGDNALALPYGPFDPRQHRTFEIGLREWVTRQTRVSLGYVEQLYTFGDRGREGSGSGRSLSTNMQAGAQGSPLEHLVSVGYLALAPEPATLLTEEGRWQSWYQFFPWEDWRNGEPPILSQFIMPRLRAWIDQSNDPGRVARRQTRLQTAFGLNDVGWEEERILERFELMYEASLVAESAKMATTPDVSALKTGIIMASDHRRILATAIARLRGKLKYRPVIFEMMPATFTLYQLQQSVEAIVGFALHKQNFRRSVEGAGLVERTGTMSDQTGGRPAALFRVNRTILKDRAAQGLVIPRLRQRPQDGSKHDKT